VTPVLGTPSSGNLTNCTFPTLNQNTTGTAAGLSATLAVTSGGTGATSANAAANAILPSQTSNSGKYLTTNGTDTSWGTVSSGSTLPTGALMPYAGSSAPTGYLLCDGSSVSSSTYLALHAVLSNTYGGSAYTGAGALSFNLPDLRGRLPMGAGTGTGQNASGTGAPSGTAQTARTRGQWLGEETHLLTTSEMPSHAHNGATGDAGSHSHTLSKEVLTYMGSGGSRYDPYPGSVWTGSPAAGLTISTQANHSHTIPSNGSDGRHATIPPVVVLNYIIKT
jgi:microcystin-dependent protein